MTIDAGVLITNETVRNACHGRSAPPELFKAKVIALLEAGIVVSIEDVHGRQVFHGRRCFERWFAKKLVQHPEAGFDAVSGDAVRPGIIVSAETIQAAHKLEQARTDFFRAAIVALIDVGNVVAVDGGCDWQEFPSSDEFLEWFQLTAPKPPEFFGHWHKYQTAAAANDLAKQRRGRAR